MPDARPHPYPVTHSHRYEGLAAPYLYPRYGLGELPQVRVGSAADLR